MAKYTVIAGQGLLDVAVVSCGTVEAVLAITALNPGINLNSPLRGGQVLNVPDAFVGTPASRRVVAFMQTLPIKPATLQVQNYRVVVGGEARIITDNQKRYLSNG